MDTSVRWINDYLEPTAEAEEQAELLTRAGFPLEGTESVDPDDVRQDFEMTSNRGDCVCHFGLAREIAALSGRTLKRPDERATPTGPPASDFITVVNEDHEGCPLYTARVIRGVEVKESPQWLKDRLIARGDIPRNNVVDATNFVLFEMGQPTHVFDLANLKDHTIRIRRATKDEPFLPLGEGAEQIKLTTDDLVIADGERAVAMAGVKGGAESSVTPDTTDIVIEAATFDHVGVRESSRRHGISSDSSYRFERGVHPGQIEAAAERLASLILEVAGGEYCSGVVSDGASIPERRHVSMRVDRCLKILGVDMAVERMMEALAILEFEPTLDGDTITCCVPFHRLDIEREIDLIEEVGRMFGYDNIPIADSIPVRVTAPQSRVAANRVVNDTLVGLGLVETVTHSLIGDDAAKLFLPPGMTELRLEDDRAKSEPVLRPSVLPSLLRVFAHNRDNGVTDVKLFERASTFAIHGDDHLETVNVGVLLTADEADLALRQMRGVIDRLIGVLRGPDAEASITAEDALPWFDPCAVVRFNNQVLGTYGMIAGSVADHFGIDQPVCCAELGLPALYDIYPPDTEAHALPSFPAIARDVSAIVDETTTWSTLESAVRSLDLEHLEAIEFVAKYRGKQIPKGQKSLTMRLRFRSPEATLKHEDVDGRMDVVLKLLSESFNATIRS